jgi:hypothetical protein
VIVEQKICPEFEIAPEEALKDAEEFVNNLASHGILSVADSPIVSSKPTQGEAR